MAHTHHHSFRFLGCFLSHSFDLYFWTAVLHDKSTPSEWMWQTPHQSRISDSAPELNQFVSDRVKTDNKHGAMPLITIPRKLGLGHFHSGKEQLTPRLRKQLTKVKQSLVTQFQNKNRVSLSFSWSVNSFIPGPHKWHSMPEWAARQWTNACWCVRQRAEPWRAVPCS